MLHSNEKLKYVLIRQQCKKISVYYIFTYIVRLGNLIITETLQTKIRLFYKKVIVTFSSFSNNSIGCFTTSTSCIF